jgi:hypothetical protein
VRSPLDLVYEIGWHIAKGKNKAITAMKTLLAKTTRQKTIAKVNTDTIEKARILTSRIQSSLGD